MDYDPEQSSYYALKAGTILFCDDDLPESIELARKYVTDNNFTAEEVKIVRRFGLVIVETRKGILWPKPKQISFTKP